MRLISALFSSCALLAAGPVLAKEPKEAKPDSERKICKPIQVTGSRLAPKRECRTAAEWEAIRKDAKDNQENMPPESQRVN